MQLQVATLLAAVMTSAGSDPDSCVTVSQQRCRFPFTFNNTEYSACTGAGHPIGRPWCYTAEVVLPMPCRIRSSSCCLVSNYLVIRSAAP